MHAEIDQWNRVECLGTALLIYSNMTYDKWEMDELFKWC